jgi:hypothetical protein
VGGLLLLSLLAGFFLWRRKRAARSSPPRRRSIDDLVDLSEPAAVHPFDTTELYSTNTYRPAGSGTSSSGPQSAYTAVRPRSFSSDSSQGRDPFADSGAASGASHAVLSRSHPSASSTAETEDLSDAHEGRPPPPCA